MAENFDWTNKANFKTFLQNQVTFSLFLDPVGIKEVLNNINSLSTHKSVGHDNIPPNFLRVASSIIAPPLCYYFNSAFQFGILPSHYKIAKVAPIFKSGKKIFRPIIDQYLY